MAHIPGGRPGKGTFRAMYVGCREEERFFECGALELAEKLVGEYLYCHETHIAVRILETEAYPVDDASVYNAVFNKEPGNPQFKFEGGVILVCNRDGSAPEKNFFNSVMYITAGKADSGDVVLLRSCEPIEGHHLIQDMCGLKKNANKKTKNNMLVGPYKVSRGLRFEWGRNSVLYRESGMQLFLSDPPEVKLLFCGRRELPNWFPSDLTDLKEYRFALGNTIPDFEYWMKSTTKPKTPIV